MDAPELISQGVGLVVVQDLEASCALSTCAGAFKAAVVEFLDKAGDGAAAATSATKPQSTKQQQQQQQQQSTAAATAAAGQTLGALQLGEEKAEAVAVQTGA